MIILMHTRKHSGGRRRVHYSTSNPSTISTFMASTYVVFSVRRHEPVLVAPAKPTPRESKPLSDIDDFMRFHIAFMHVFRGSTVSKGGRDPAKVIKNALSEALVFYYPLAGRLRESIPSRKLAVDCTGEGVLFVEADADAELEIFGDELKPPFPCQEELLHTVEGSNDTLNSPLLLIQVTRFRCGGFTFAFRINHTMADGAGIVQFMKAMAEIACGADTPLIMPVWMRELLTSSNKPLVNQDNTAFDHTNSPYSGGDRTVHRCFFFGPEEISALRLDVPPHLQESSWFDVLTATLWRCRTSAIGAELEEVTRLLFPVDIRRKRDSPLPTGYYGNAVPHPVAECKAAELCSRPLSYAMELVKKAKCSVADERVKSIADDAAEKARAPLELGRAFIISDTARLGLDEVDFGWGKAAYAGFVSTTTLAPNVYIRGRSKEGEDGILAYMSLPAIAMEKLASEIESMTKKHSSSI